VEDVRFYKDLVVWQKAMDLAVEVHRIAQRFPNYELYALSSQLRRAAVSVPANIAEGNARATPRDYAQFLAIARGSLAETETLLALAVRLEYIESADCLLAEDLIQHIGRIINILVE
jgi:four helix bundle protein